MKEQSLVIDIARMIRKGWIREGCCASGSLRWTWADDSTSTISYAYDLSDADSASLTLTYRNRPGGGEWRDRRQHIPLVHTSPHFGGRRWWMICPVRGNRVGKLYLPGGGDIFAGRKAWCIAYNSQRAAHRDRPFDALHRLQRKLGCEEGWDEGIRRPKGMWQRTFDRHYDRYLELDEKCSREMLSLMRLLDPASQARFRG